MATAPTSLTYKFTRASGVTTVEINDILFVAIVGTPPAICRYADISTGFNIEVPSLKWIAFFPPDAAYVVNGVDRTADGMASIAGRVMAEAFLGA